MGDGNDSQSILAKLPDILQSLAKLISALILLGAAIYGAYWYFFPPPPEIHTFLIDPDNITAGETTLLSWDVLNADYIYINHEVGKVRSNGSNTITPDPTFTSYKIMATNRKNISANKTYPISVKLKNLSLYCSPYKEMNVNEIYQFDVSVAMKDSKEAALKGIHLTSHNESVISNVNPNKIINNSVMVNISESKLTGAYLTLTGDKVGDKNAFNITLRTPVDSSIFKQSPGDNYVIWHWDVVPLQTGPHILTITAGLRDDLGNYMRLFDDTYIEVNVKPVAAPAANVTTAATGAVAGAEAAAKTAVNATANKTAAAAAGAAKNATAQATKTPGFEGIFAIAGLMAVAYLVLDRKQ